MPPDVTYASYLLRLWQVRSDTTATWVVVVQSSATGEQRRFPSVDALVAFLQSEFGAKDPPDAELGRERPGADRAERSCF